MNTKTVRVDQLVDRDVILIDGEKVTLRQDPRRMPPSWLVRQGRKWIQLFGMTEDGEYRCRGYEDDELVELVACKMMVEEPYAPCGCERHMAITTDEWGEPIG